jgi:dihydrofolate reductase
MAELIYSAITSLDGYVVDEHGDFDWAAPDDELHAFVNEQERPIGTYLYGRRMYEVMVAWETMPMVGQPTVVQEYAEIWRAADKIVYSRTLEAPSSARTQLERTFDPDPIRTMKERTEPDLSIGGPGLAAGAIAAGLVDEVRLFLTPILVGGGTRALPDHVRTGLSLVDERRFAGGVVHLRYRTEA